MSSSSSSWQDRRFMFPAGREVHQGSRRYSGSKESADPASLATSPSTMTTPTTTAPPPTPADTEAPTMIGKILPSWDGDRRFMGTTPKEIHQGPARRGSQSSEKSAGAAGASGGPIKSSASPPTSPGGGIAAAIAGRRRVCGWQNTCTPPLPPSLPPSRKIQSGWWLCPVAVLTLKNEIAVLGLEPRCLQWSDVQPQQ